MYQAEHPHYDRFLPHLCRFVEADEAIVDVGANVGDSVAAMVDSNPKPTFVCVEADETFYRYLTENIERIKRSWTAVKIHPIKCLVGKSVSFARMEGKQGTKRAVAVTEGATASQPLDEILLSLPSVPKVRVIKTDVDGFDYDVIESAMLLVERDKPIIFFECDFSTDTQRVGFEDVFSALESRGYSDWALFDNFGQLMLRTDTIETLKQLMNYIWQQKQGNATRTIYYFDVLASHLRDRSFVTRVLESY
jgi:FkbM family methyltransferase